MHVASIRASPDNNGTDPLAVLFTSPLMKTVRPGPMGEFNLAANGRVWRENTALGSLQKVTSWENCPKTQAMFKGLAQQAPAVSTAWLTVNTHSISEEETSKHEAGPEIPCVSETRSEKVAYTWALQRAAPSAWGGGAAQVGAFQKYAAQRLDAQLTLLRSGSAQKCRGAALGFYWG